MRDRAQLHTLIFVKRPFDFSTWVCPQILLPFFIFKEAILDGWFRGLNLDRIMTNPYGSFDGYLGFRFQYGHPTLEPVLVRWWYIL